MQDGAGVGNELKENNRRSGHVFRVVEVLSIPVVSSSTLAQERGEGGASGLTATSFGVWCSHEHGWYLINASGHIL